MTAVIGSIGKPRLPSQEERKTRPIMSQPKRPAAAPPVVLDTLFGPGEMPTPDRIADILPWLTDEVRKAFETRDQDGTGRTRAGQLSIIASLLEQYCLVWANEREREAR